MQPACIRRGLPESADSFNPHPPLRADATTNPWVYHRPDLAFQSSPTLTGGCNLPLEEGDAPERMLFQSSPTLTGGCNYTSTPAPGNSSTGFNPHPPLRADATSTKAALPVPAVEFQSSPTLTGGCNEATKESTDAMREVSILTHPYGRMQPVTFWTVSFRPFSFQSSPTLTGGCNGVGRPVCHPNFPLDSLAHAEQDLATPRISVTSL